MIILILFGIIFIVPTIAVLYFGYHIMKAIMEEIEDDDDWQ